WFGPRMIGQGSPTRGCAQPARWNVAPGAIVCAMTALLFASSHTLAEQQTVRLRIEWGGAQPRLWQGRVAIEHGALVDLQPLGLEADEPGSMWMQNGEILIQQRSPRAYD